ncbi:unnamed protein product, partial [marine sediment metagenome]
QVDGSLWAGLDITSEATQKDLKLGNLKYISAQIIMDWPNPEDGKFYNIIRSGCLTNFPYIKNLEPAIVNFSEIRGIRESQTRRENHRLFLAEKERDQFRQAGSQLLTALLSERQARLVETTDRKLNDLVAAGRLFPYEIPDTKKILLSGGETAKAHLKLIEQRKPVIDMSQKAMITAKEKSPIQRLRELAEIMEKGNYPPDQEQKILKEMNDIAEKYDKKIAGR